MNLKRIAAPAIITGLLLLLYFPTVLWLVHAWLSNSYYSHGFLIPVVSAVIIWTRREQLRQREPSSAGWAVAAAGILVYAIAFVWNIRSLAALSLLVVITGLVLCFFGTRATRSISFPLAYLVFMIPLPIIEDVGYFLQRISVTYSSSLVRLVGVPVTVTGTEIDLDGTVFSIGLPCSGINSLVALLALAAVLAYVLRGPTYKRTIVFLAGFPLAILGNIVRIASVILIARYYNVEFATGPYHDVSTLIFFLIAFAVLMLLGRLLGCRLSHWSQEE